MSRNLFWCIMHVWISIVGTRENNACHFCIFTSYSQMFWLWGRLQSLKVWFSPHWRTLVVLQTSGKLLGRRDISKRHSAEQEKSLNTAVFLPGFCSYSHLTAEQTMTGWGGIADTSPSMCENKSAQGWRPVCLQQSWKFQWPRHGGGLHAF